MPSAAIRPILVQRTSSDSSFSKIKHWFNKGSEIHGDKKASHRAKRKRQKDNGSAGQETHAADVAGTRPYPISPLGPRLSPPAVHVEARSNTSEGDKESIALSLRSSPASSLTSAQSHVSLEQPQRPKPTHPAPRTVPISLPQPRQSLFDLTSDYADVQNPARATKPAPVATHQPPQKQDERRRLQEYRAVDQPIREVATGRPQVVTPPAHQRSQKTVVRKMVPPPTPRTDHYPRPMYRETRFEDFMGKSSSPAMMPPLPARTSPDARLSRPFASAAAKESEEPVVGEETGRPGTASTAALSVSDPRAQTWLRYDRHHGESARVPNTADAPLFPPRRDLVVPDQDPRIKYSPCQICARQVHPSTAFSYNGTYLCEDCAATGPWGEKKPIAKKQKKMKKDNNKSFRTSVFTPTTPGFAGKYSPASTLSTGSTLRGSLSPGLSPGNAYPYLQSPSPSYPPPSDPRFSTATTFSPQSPSFGTDNAQYPRYRTPPPPPIITTGTFPSDSPLSSPPPLTSPLRRPKPASSIYPSTPWRLSRPPSLPDIPDQYISSHHPATTEKKKRQRDTVVDIIDAYGADSPSPVSPMSDKLVEANIGESYVNAGWRTRRNNLF
ncbi:hypothetical protein XPA_002659 [Xanthoria parietina]